jgi:uncharacterized FlaG/YvyC family protein
MTIDISNLASIPTMIVDSKLRGAAVPAKAAPTVPTVVDEPSSASAPASVDAATMKDATQQIQAYLSGQTTPPQFNVDYLSGLDVMTVRAANTGEVVFQMPGVQALQLAQLLREGAPVESLGIVNTVA